MFKKPNGLKYTDMCIYIDDVVARGNPTVEEENKVFEYLYHVAFMLAHKHKYFNKSYYYEEFALYFATSTMHRLLFNPRLGKVDENGEPVLTKIKSCLNYMKSVIYPRKVEFEQNYYSQKYSEFDESNFLYSFNTNPYDAIRETDVSLYLRRVRKTIKKVVYDKNFYKSDKLLMKNIYISCLLTTLNGLTLSVSDKKNFDQTYTSMDAKYRYLTRLYSKNREDALILYHLDESFESYVKVLTNKIYKELKEDLTYLSGQRYELSDSIMSNILFLEVQEEDGSDGYY